MSTPGGIRLRRHGRDEIAGIRRDLVEVYAEVYREALADPFHSAERFAERLERYSSAAGWEVVMGFDGDAPVGYAFGSPLAPTTRWWEDIDPPPADDFARETGHRTFALFELMVRASWRRTGVARAIHDELILGRPEERVTLLVEQTHDRVRARYEAWGYARIGEQRPFPDAPVYDVMVRRLGGGRTGSS